MLDLVKVNLPDSVKVDGRFFLIHTDFRKWLSFDEILRDKSATLDNLDAYYVNEIPEDKIKGFQALYDFYAPKKTIPRIIEDGEPVEKVLDYKLDADFIYAAFMEMYHIDLLATDENGKIKELHWHKFQALLNGIHDTKLNEIMGFRSFNPNDKTPYEKQMQKLKEQWQLPQPADAKVQEDLEKFNSLLD